MLVLHACLVSRPRSPHLLPFHYTITGPTLGVAAAFPYTFSSFPHHHRASFGSARPRFLPISTAWQTAV
ncbi:MAG: hypothetical protein KA314_14290 [Chloroflexi bacterium]|nr:hypothetical protein [Chloroflexota bacterium]MBP8057003.1 hypothetical protein [Chloroflexota bacterium]